MVGHQEAEGQVKLTTERGSLPNEATCVEFVAHRRAKLRRAHIESSPQATVALADFDQVSARVYNILSQLFFLQDLEEIDAQVSLQVDRAIARVKWTATLQLHVYTPRRKQVPVLPLVLLAALARTLQDPIEVSHLSHQVVDIGADLAFWDGEGLEVLVCE